MTRVCRCDRCTGRPAKWYRSSPTHQYIPPPRSYYYTPPVTLPPLTPAERVSITNLWLRSLRRAGVTV